MDTLSSPSKYCLSTNLEFPNRIIDAEDTPKEK